MTIYGDFNLQRGDYDGDIQSNTPPKWGAIDNPQTCLATAETPQNQGGNTCAIYQYVRDLQEDLRELGFLIIKGDANGTIDNNYRISNPHTAHNVADENISGKFGMTTEWAVKEFQIYARMERVAQLDLDALHTLVGEDASETAWSVAGRGMVPTATNLPAGSTPPPVSYHVATLSQITNATRYTGPISGVVNQATRGAIDHWKRNNYRCPVVIEMWNVDAQKQRTTLVANGANLWHTMEIENIGTSVYLYFRDFTNHYTYPAGHTPAMGQYQVLGKIVKYSNNPAGPQSFLGSHTLRSAEILPQTLINETATIENLQDPANMEAAIASTYRVVRAISEVECLGQFDGYNAYDHALFSMGICHWTLALVRDDNNYTDAELAGLFCYFFNRYPAEYRDAIGRFGLYPNKLWQTENRHLSNQSSMWIGGSQKKYAGWYRWHNETNVLNEAQSNSLQLPEVSKLKKEADYFKTWHWIFRWVMLGRTNECFRHAQWDMTRMRIQDILNHQLTLPQITITPAVQSTGETGTTPAVAPIQVNLNNRTLGELFTSEKSVAYLLRMHVNSPWSVITPEPTPYSSDPPPADPTEFNWCGRAAKAVRMAIINNPSLPNWNNPALWTNAHETVLTESLYAWGRTANGAIKNTLSRVMDWRKVGSSVDANYQLQFQLGTLRTARNSFRFCTTNI